MLDLIEVDVRAILLRGINEETAEKFQYGFGEFNGKLCHVAQYRNAKGQVVAQKLRFKDKSFVVTGDLKETGLFGQHLWRDAGMAVIITEGEIDTLSMSQVQDNRFPVVSIPTGAKGAKAAITKALEWLDQFERVVFMFDMDEPGQEAARECAALLQPGKAYIASLPLKDANDMLMAKRSKELIDAFWGAKVFRPDGLISGEEVWQKIIEEDLADSVPFPHNGLQTAMRGMRVGELTTLVAGTGSGKSTYCRELAAHLITQGKRIGYVALEESVRRSALGLMSIVLNKPLHQYNNEVIDTPEVRAAFDSIKDRVVFYDHFGSLQSDHLLSKLRFLAKGEKCDYIILDHLSIVVSGMDLSDDERRSIDLTMTRLAALTQETGVGIIMVCHLTRPSQGPAHEEGRVITLKDLRGSGGIAQLSRNVIALERDQQDEATKNIGRLRVLKCTHTGFTGEVGLLKYNPETGRLLEYMQEFEPIPEEKAEFA